MGLLDSLENIAGIGGSGTQEGSVAQALIQTAEQHGGFGSILSGFRQNGMDQHVNSWVNPGPNQSINPDQVQQGMGGGMIDQIAQRAGISPEIAKVVLAGVLPLVASHFAQNGRI